jgi:hypothetical protein
VPQGKVDISKSRYTSHEFAALENEYLWTRTWQMACTSDELAQPGDHVVYDVADQSVIVTRTKDGAIKAFHNSCLHRGTKLRTESGRVASFRSTVGAGTSTATSSSCPPNGIFPKSGINPTRVFPRHRSPNGAVSFS